MKRKRNPVRVAKGPRVTRGTKLEIIAQLGNVHQLAYRHHGDGQDYFHEFKGGGPTLFALEGGSLLIAGDRELWVDVE